MSSSSNHELNLMFQRLTCTRPAHHLFCSVNFSLWEYPRYRVCAWAKIRERIYIPKDAGFKGYVSRWMLFWPYNLYYWRYLSFSSSIFLKIYRLHQFLRKTWNSLSRWLIYPAFRVYFSVSKHSLIPSMHTTTDNQNSIWTFVGYVYLADIRHPVNNFQSPI